jgi:DNA-binding GntR family transcriptional regulator
VSTLEQPMISSLQPVDRRRLHEMVLAQLLSAMRDGQLKQGERLREEQIAAQLGLSRGTVREAIRRLEEDGLVVSEPHRGTFIASLSPAETAEIFALRRLFEGYALRLVVTRVTAENLADLERITWAMIEASERQNLVDRIRLDHEFHERICLMSGNHHLHRLWSKTMIKLWLAFFDRQHAAIPDPGRVTRSRSHFDLIACLKAGDVEAAVAWNNAHIENSERRVRSRSNETSSG